MEDSKDAPLCSTYPPKKEKDVAMGDSEAKTCDTNEPIQSSPLNTGTDEEKGEVSAPADPTFVVWWEEPADQDPENPMNWPMSRKWATIAVLSTITFLTFVAFHSLFLPS